uniref:Transmembrane protein 138 n=1 Tax=Hemiselmis tepida TaxID=464990 RepID=A0A7S0YXD0_9CRYP|mmetsp:Transcript_29336/g.74371  ORF Transcript_29336/g.74371 Transcript_29336/m.74371 type:complete len:171 (+) Transcript_29336:212-724(+)
MGLMIVLALTLLVGDVVLLGFITYRILKFGELEDDHMNPTDFARDMNYVFPLELGLQAFMLLVQTWMIFAFSGTPQLLAILINLGYLGWHLHLFTSNQWKVDAAKVWNPTFKKTSQTHVLIGVVVYGLLFFLFLYNVIRVLTNHPKGDPRPAGKGANRPRTPFMRGRQGY